MSDSRFGVAPCADGSNSIATVDGVNVSVKHFEPAQADSSSVVKIVGERAISRMRSSHTEPMFADGSAMGMQAITLRRIEASDSLEELTAMLQRAFSRLGRMGLNCTCVDQSVQVTRERIEKGDCYIAACAGRLVGTVTPYAPDCQSQSHW